MITIAERPYIVYSLPKERTSQVVLGGKIEKVWNNIQKFLSNCTNVNVETPDSISLAVYSANEEWNEPFEPANTIIKKAQEIFGKGKTSPVSYMYPSGEPSKQIKVEWDLEIKDLSKALTHLISEQPYPKYNLGPIELIVSYYFNLVNTLTKEILPNQQFQSTMLIWIAKRNHVSPCLNFPFVEPNQDFWSYIKSIEAYLPFKFEEKNLRLVAANKKGTDNVWKKL